RRNFVDVEPEPVGKQNNFRRNSRDRVVIVLPKKAEINFGKGVDLGDAAQLQYLLPGALHCRMIWFISSQLESKVRFHRGAYIRRATLINRPAAVFILIFQDVIGAFPKAFGISRSK